MPEPRNRSDIVRDVGRRLIGAELMLDDVFAETAQLAAALPAARIEAGLGIRVGAGAVSDAAEALAHLAKAREALGRAHRGLEGVQLAIGDRTVMTGGGDKYVPDEIRASAAEPASLEPKIT